MALSGDGSRIAFTATGNLDGAPSAGGAGIGHVFTVDVVEDHGVSRADDLVRRNSLPDGSYADEGGVIALTADGNELVFGGT